MVYEYGRGWEYVWWEINKNNAVDDYLLEQEWSGEINELEKNMSSRFCVESFF